MKVVTSHTMQEIDKRTIEDFAIPGLQLMESAGSCCVEEIIREFGHTGHKRAVVLAGKGNNGGDGYVIARQLSRQGWDVKVFILGERDQIGGDAAINLELLSSDMVTFCRYEGELTSLFRNQICQAGVVVDA